MMMQSNFEKAITAVLKSEGGFTDDPRDPGNRLPDGRKGCTNLGVTQAAWEAYVGHPVSEADMRALTPEKVSPFYKRKFWDVVHGDDLPIGVDYLSFDFAINAGPGRSIKTLQEALGVTADGAIGPGTLSAIHAADPKELVEKFSEMKDNFYKSLPTFGTFGAGWLRRVAEVKVLADSMIG